MIKKMIKKKRFWVGVVAALGAAGVALPPGVADAIMALVEVFG